MATLLRAEKATTTAPRPAERNAWSGVPLAAFGATFTLVGLVDLGMAWLPPQLGVGEWEFGVVSRTFDNLTLLTVGTGLLLAAAVLRRSFAGLRVLSIFFGLFTLVLLGAIAIYALNVPLALKAVPEQARSALGRAVSRTSVFALIYIVLYGWLSWFTWRRAGALGRGEV